MDGQAGAVQMLRAQRTVFVIWNVPAPGTTVGLVILQNVPDQVKRLSNVIIPDAAKTPVTRDAVDDLPSFTFIDPPPRILAIGSLDQLDWVQDGVAESEAAAVEALDDLARESQPLFEAVMGKPWVQDGINADELTVVEKLTFIAGRDEARALSVIQMPFLETVDAADDSVVNEMLFYHVNDVSERMGVLNHVLSHPTLSGGIRDEHVHVLTALLSLMRVVNQESRATLYSTLLDPEAVIVEQRAVSLPVSGNVLLAVVRTRNGSASSMDWLERSLRSHEGFIGLPLPGNYVSLFVGGFYGGGATADGILRIPDSFGDPGLIIAHESARLYWSSGWGWATNGGAEFLRWVALGKGPPLYTFTLGVDSCDTARSLSELQQKTDDSTIDWRSICHYRMGYAFFYDLYQTLGEQEFRRGLRELRLNQKRSSSSGLCMVPRANQELCWITSLMRAAFVTSAPDPDVAARAWHVIHRWYYGP